MVCFFYTLAVRHSSQSASDSKQQLQEYQELKQEAATFLSHVNATIELIAPFYSDENLTHETVTTIITELKSVKEPAFKAFLVRWLEVCDLTDNPGLREKARAFIGKEYYYFIDNSFMNNELEEYNSLMRETWLAVSLHKFSLYKKMLNHWVTLLPKNTGQ